MLAKTIRHPQLTLFCSESSSYSNRASCPHNQFLPVFVPGWAPTKWFHYSGALFSISTAFRTWRCFRPVSVPVLISSPYARFKRRNFHKHVQNVMYAFELWLSVFTANLLLENATPENFIWFKLHWLIDHHSVTDPVKPCPVVLFSLPSDKPPGYLTHSVFLQG